MTTGIQSLTGRPGWKALESHYKKIRKLHLRKLFADDPTRGERLTASAAGIELDYSKNRITDETLELLFQLAKDAGLRERIDAVFLPRPLVFVAQLPRNGTGKLPLSSLRSLAARAKSTATT